MTRKPDRPKLHKIARCSIWQLNAVKHVYYCLSRTSVIRCIRVTSARLTALTYYLLKKDIAMVVLQVPAGTEGCRHHCCSFVMLRMKAVLSLYKLNVDKRYRLVFSKAADKDRNLLPASIVKDFCMAHYKACPHRQNPYARYWDAQHLFFWCTANLKERDKN